MTNSMSNTSKVIELVTAHTDVLKQEVVDAYQVSFVLDKNDIHKTLSVLKAEGWIQLSYLSAVDWPEDNTIELVYIVFNWEQAVYIQLRTTIDRTNPVMQTILPLYEGCKYYEREVHEFFGVSFPGNKDHEKQLILEEWDDIPPLRKDFDPRAYSDKKFKKREFPGSFQELNSKESKKKQRSKRKKRAMFVRKGEK